jgi:photosystem II stability/assembly factor-like uncharacterized protein
MRNRCVSLSPPVFGIRQASGQTPVPPDLPFSLSLAGLPVPQTRELEDHSMNISVRLTGILAAALAGTVSVAMPLSDLAGRTHYHGIAFARAGSAELLLATHHGLFAVDSAGEATQLSPVQDYMGFAPDPADPLGYYASGHPAEGGNSGFLATRDGGATWTQISEGLDGPVDFHQMAVSPADPRTIYGVYGAVQVSRDAGETWAVAGAAPPKLIALAASGAAAEQVYAATEAGLLHSSDAGASWRPLAFEGEAVTLVETAADGSFFVFVLGRGLLRADAAMATVNLLSDDFGQAVPLHLAIDPEDPDHLVLTTQSNDVLESRDGGRSWKAFGSPS